jgi:branched-chain amino acid transport system permease protein
VDQESGGGRPWTGSRPARLALPAAGLAAGLVLPWTIYPPVAVDILCWGLFAVAIDLLLGQAGLLSFGHAAFWGGAGYATGLVAVHTGAPFPVALLAGAGFAMLLAVPIGLLAIRRTGIYFAMVTLAFAQTLYYLANKWRGLTGGENGLQDVPRSLPGYDVSQPFRFYYAVLPVVVLALWLAWRVVRSPFGRVLTAVRDNPERARSLGYPVDRYKLAAFVVSAGLTGLGGGLFTLAHGFASLDGLYWTSSGQGVLMTVLGGIGTLWGPLLGAGAVVRLQDWLSTSGFNGPGIILGGVFIAAVLVFRSGIWGSGAALLRRFATPGAARAGVPAANLSRPDGDAPGLASDPAAGPGTRRDPALYSD